MAWTLTIIWLHYRISSHKSDYNIVPPAVFLHPENAPKSLAAGASPRTPLGELIALPRPPSWIKGPTSKGRKGEGKKGEVLWTLTMLETD